MRRALGYTLAWCGATALAVGVSWLGVRDVLRSAVLDEAPLAPLVAVAAASPPGAGVTAIGTPAANRATEEPVGPPSPSPPPVRPTPSVRPGGRPSPSPVRSARRPATPRPSRTAAPPTAKAAASGETLHTFTLKGGRATIAVTARDCRVVTATPNDGYEVRVWETDSWLRVAFLQAPHESSAFCTWNALPPRLDTYEN
ncbi:hypothetical protein [Microbispora sp. ATCC PTA-5024]|uniref:hypothetical protein n=1 Tax=Microbispora sp. ATCC PTA-5024 TaxID=316330 RepID=UPI0003DBF809|nr:hypothetical protein [Microbispora sp. ATCC PTA-5024]ETK33756.1 hypothetical protein MPTA5024_22740 [Microbispora sp. ATCC PTA-5024]